MTMIGSKSKIKKELIDKLLHEGIKRVAIVGSAGVGKTTLLESLFKDEAIAAKFQKIPEVVRTLCQERGYESPYDIPEDQVHKFREDVLDKQIESENQAESFIVDRSCLDAWIYFMRWSWNSVSVEDSERFYQKAFEQAKKYDALIYLPISFELKDDGFRWANKTYQKQIDRLFRENFQSWNLEELLLPRLP